ncbi:MAG TPA: oxygenase MpaB family protein [Baekduia sp.]|nr:oxygenase MpaB family protein [Baekduia sp.]
MTTAGYFNEASLLRRVHREKVVGLSGPRALLMMAAHPLAFEGFFMATGSLDDPYLRLRRTAEVLDAVAWGTKAEAGRRTRRVRAMHARAHGVLPRDAGPYPAGTPWAADDPELLLWILACLVDSAVLVYERYVTRLSVCERDDYWRDYRVVGRLFGLRDADMPASWREFEAYMSNMLTGGELVVTPTARAVGIEVVLRPPTPLKVRPLVELANFITVGLLPSGIRRGYGFSWDPARAMVLRGGAEYAKRVLVPLLPVGWRYVPGAVAAA